MPGPSWLKQAAHQITHTHLSRSIGFEICSLEERDVHALGQENVAGSEVSERKQASNGMDHVIAISMSRSPVEGYALFHRTIGPTAGGKSLTSKKTRATSEWHPCHSTLGSARTAWTNRRADLTQVSRCAHEVSLFYSFAHNVDSRSCRKLNP